MARRQVNLTDEDIDFVMGLLARAEAINYRDAKRVSEKLERSRRQITRASAKGKGRALQDWVGKRIAGLLNVEFSKSDDDALVSSRQMGQHGVDIILRRDARKLFPFAVECKSTEQLSLKAAWEQARSNEAEGVHALLVYKNKSLSEPLAIMEWGTFESMMVGVLAAKEYYRGA